MITPTESESIEEEGDDAESPQYEASPPVESTDSPEYVASSQEDEPVPDSNLLTTIEEDKMDEEENEGETKKIN